MPQKYEREDEDALCARVLRELGVPSIKMNLLGNRGYPDRVFLLPLRPAWLEFKRLGKVPRKLQAYRIKQLNALGYDAKWSDDYEACYDWIKTLHAARLSEVGHKEDDRASVRWTIVRSGFGKDLHKSRDDKDSNR